MPFFAPRRIDPNGQPIAPITNQAELEAYLARNIPVLLDRTQRRLAAEQAARRETPSNSADQAAD